VDKPDSYGANWILKAMIAVAVSDGQLHDREVELIRQIYQDQSGRSVTAEGVRAVAKATKSDLSSEIAAAAKSLDRNIKEEMIRAAYLVLLADELIVQQESKELKDIAAALEISETDYGAILRDLALWLAEVRR